MGYQANYKSRTFSRGTVALARARQTGSDGILRCAMCRTDLLGTDDTHEDHIIPWWISGHSGPRNCQLLCVPCHDAKTYKDDVPDIAKIKRLHRRRKVRHPMPCGRVSRFTKPVGAIAPVLRRSQAEKHRAMIARRFPSPEPAP